MNPRVQLKHVLLDVDFFDKPTIRALGFKHTQVAVLLYIRWLMLMSRASDALVTRDALASIAREVLSGMGTAIATFDSVLQYCLTTKMIIEVSKDVFSADRVIKDQESCAVKRDQAIQRQSKFREKKNGNVNALSTRLPDTVTDTVTDTVLDSSLKKKSCRLRPLGNATVQQCNPDYPEALKRWIAYRAERKAKLTQSSINQILKKYADNVADLERDVDHSISQGWQGLYAPKEQAQHARAGPQLKPSQNLVNQMVSQKAVEQIIREERQNDARRDGKNIKQSILALPEPNVEP